MSNKVYNSTPHGYAWSTITHNGNVAYKVSVYDKDGKYNVPEKQNFKKKKVGLLSYLFLVEDFSI